MSNLCASARINVQTAKNVQSRSKDRISKDTRNHFLLIEEMSLITPDFLGKPCAVSLFRLRVPAALEALVVSVPIDPAISDVHTVIRLRPTHLRTNRLDGFAALSSAGPFGWVCLLSLGLRKEMDLPHTLSFEDNCGLALHRNAPSLLPARPDCAF